MAPKVTAESLAIDAEAVVGEIVDQLKETVDRQLRKRGAVVALSGGVDSSVCAALAARAFGPQKVLGIFMPETDSAGDTLDLSRLSAESAGIPTVLEDITAILDATGCYRRRDDAFRQVLRSTARAGRRRSCCRRCSATTASASFSVVAESPDGERHEARLTSSRVPRGRRGDELQAADAEDARVPPRRPARLRGRGHAEQARVRPGFLRQERRRRGRREADRAPLQDPGVRDRRGISVPEEIRSRPPTTDTYALPQSQEEFYFSLPYDKMDLCLYAQTNGSRRGGGGGRGPVCEDVERVYKDIEAKHRVTEYLARPPVVF